MSLDGPPPFASSSATVPRRRCWVAVLGMHRSGTSAVTGAVARLGCALPRSGDLLAGYPGNPIHYESRTLTEFDDHVLNALGGSWSAPPLPDRGWESSELGRQWASSASEAALDAFPSDRRLVWKDPRACLLLPFWRAALGDPCAVVLVWRDPVAVAESLCELSGWPLSHGLSLWEWYTTHVLSSLAGLNVLVEEYDAILDHPRRFCEQVAELLAASNSEAQGLDPDAAGAEAILDRSLRHQRSDTRKGHALATDAPLIACLRDLHGAHGSFALPDLPPISSWSRDFIELRRDYERVHQQVRSRVNVEAELGRLGRVIAELSERIASYS